MRPVDDAAVRNPGDNKRCEEREHRLDWRVDCQNLTVDVCNHSAVMLRKASLDDVGPEQLRTVDNDAHCPHTAHTQRCHLCREIPSTDSLQTQQSASNATTELKHILHSLIAASNLARHEHAR